MHSRSSDLHLRTAGAAAGAALLICLSAPAPAVAAAVPPNPGTRPIGIGGALRGAATGDAALALNPSGMSLVRAYILEAAYTHDRIGSGVGHAGHLSIVDSTSGFNLGGGLYYTYLSEPGRAGHEGGLALSFPFGDRVFIGGTVKYLRIRRDDPLPVGADRVASGFTFDAGVTVRPVPAFSIGLSTQNLSDLGTSRAPRMVGSGVAVSAGNFLLTFDSVMDFSPTDPSKDRALHVMGGSEYIFAKSFAVRAGGGRRGDTEAGFLSGGLSLLSEVGALDVGVQVELVGAQKQTLVGVSARLFVPAP